MSEKATKKVDLKEGEPLQPIDDWLELLALEDDEEALDYVEDMTIPEDLMATFPAALQKMHKAYFQLVHTAMHISAYYIRLPDPEVEKVNTEQYTARGALANMFLRFLLCPRGLLLTLAYEDGKPFLVTYGRLGPFCRASDAEQAFEILWDEKLEGWNNTEFKRQEIEEKCAQYCFLLQEFDPGQPLYNRNEVFKMLRYRDKWAKLHEKVDRLSNSEAKASEELSAEQDKGERADQSRTAELDDYITNCSMEVIKTVEQLGTLDRKMRVQYQIEKFIGSRAAREPCPRLKFEYTDKEEDGDVTPRPAESNDADIMTDMAGLNDALDAAIAASKDEWEVQDISTAEPRKKSKSRRKSRSQSKSRSKGKGESKGKGKGKEACYDGDVED